MKKIVYRRQNNPSHRHVGVLLFYLAFVFFVMMFGISRFVLTHKVIAAKLVFQALFIDLTMAVFIALLAKLLHKIHITVSAVILILLIIFHIANMEMSAALNTFINIADLWNTTDAHFLRGSFFNLTFPWYSFFMLLSAVLYLVAMAKVKKSGPIKIRYLLLYIFILISCIYILSPGSGEWHSSNLLWLSITGSITGSATEYIPLSKTQADILIQPPQSVKNEGKIYFQKSPDSERNVLLVVLEGIPGVYVRQVQEWTGVKYPVVMTNLSRIAEKSVIVPNFVTHNRQTIRGLYSLLSGDYCKLSITTPKVYEYIQLPPESRNPCLPEILANAGYTTVYLQAADLAYMSKNRFMPEAGFEQVLGKEYFIYQYIPFGWGLDDRAFFEQAADFIEKLNKRPNLWFLTLLNVGTHHPCAVPEELAEKFSSRKEASVEYLDQALGDFFDRLKDIGILDNTLVVFVSDESHGVTEQPYGNYWGVAVAYSPESSGIINPGVFGLIDIPYSVLDYLGLTGQSQSFPKRSIFREQNTERSILFDSYFSERKGVVKKRISSNRVKVIQSSNGELFSHDYITKIIKGDDVRILSEKLRNYQIAANSSLYDMERKDRKYVLLENDEFIIGRTESRLLSSGQYLDIPGGTIITVELEAQVELEGEYDGRGNSRSIRLVLQLLKDYEKMSIPEIRIPTLKDQDSLQLSFSFYTEGSLYRVWAYLKAISVNQSYSTKLKIERFSIETKESEAEHYDFRINRFFIKEMGGNNHDLKKAYLRAGQNNEGAGSQNQSSSRAVKYTEKAEFLNDHFSKWYDLEILGVRFDGQASEITFSIGRLDERYDHYSISIHYKIFGPGDYNTQEIYASLNSHRVAHMWFDHDNCEKEVILYFQHKLLKEYNVNTISFKVNNPISSKELPVPNEGEPSSFELIGLILQPSLPPVAHAGGGYKGLTFTNSVEALEENVGTFNFFEIDFEWTKDKQLIGLHDWGSIFTRILGFEVEGPLDYSTFRKLETVSGITPLDLSSIKEFLSNNPEAKILTDIKYDNINALYKIAEFFPDFAERFIPQVYQPDEFTKTIEAGYKNIIWTLYRYRYIYDPVEILSHIHFWENEHNIKPFAVTMPVTAVEKGIAKAVAEVGIPVYAHTVNSSDDYARLLRLGISSIYTDYLDVTKCFNHSGEIQ